MPVYNYQCTSCGQLHESLTSYDKREEPQLCMDSACGGQATYVISAPSIRTSDSASRVDQSKPSWYKNWKEASNLRKEALNLSEKKREKHREEVKKLGETVNF